MFFSGFYFKVRMSAFGFMGSIGALSTSGPSRPHGAPDVVPWGTYFYDFGIFVDDLFNYDQSLLFLCVAQF